MTCGAVTFYSRAASFLELAVVWADYGKNDCLLWITSNICTPIRTSLHTVTVLCCSLLQLQFIIEENIKGCLLPHTVTPEA